MGTQSEVRDDEGNVVYIRETEDDGRQSRLYEADNSFAAWATGDHRGKKVEVADHHPNGTTQTYEPDDSVAAWATGDDRGEETTSSSSCCYITSACLDDLGIPRTAREMTAMKTLTRDYILKSFRGKRDYINYGRIAPKVVQSIRGRPDCRSVWENVYGKLGEVANLVGSGKYEEGHQNYKSLVFGLETQFL